MRIKETILTHLRHAIVRGEFKPGERLKERDLCRQFKASRTPIREVLNELEKEGLVVITPNVGASVINLQNKDLSNIYDMLIALESTGARLACSKISDKEIRKLEEYQFTMAKAAGKGSLDLIAELNLQFHWLITESTENPYLIEILKNFRSLAERFSYFAPFIPAQLKATLEEHPKIIDAIKQRNPPLAEFQAKEHMERAKERMIAYFRRMERIPKS